MRAYQVTLTGTSPLLQHNDDIDWADRMEEWKLDKDNKKSSKAGDDRSPAFRWVGSLYHADGMVVIPSVNVMRAMMEGGSGVLVPAGKGGKTFKAQSQSGIIPRGIGWPLLIPHTNGAKSDKPVPIPYAPIEALIDINDFKEHRARVQKMGFTLFQKRAKIGASKHIRGRPRFEVWSMTGQLLVTDDQITTAILEDILEVAGKYKGLGDWWPSSPKSPGQFGLFEATVEQVALDVKAAR